MFLMAKYFKGFWAQILNPDKKAQSVNIWNVCNMYCNIKATNLSYLCVPDPLGELEGEYPEASHLQHRVGRQGRPPS